MGSFFLELYLTLELAVQDGVRYFQIIYPYIDELECRVIRFLSQAAPSVPEDKESWDPAYVERCRSDKSTYILAVVGLLKEKSKYTHRWKDRYRKISAYA